MSYDAWSGEGRGLPRVEDLPAAEHGYERESVQRAFDAFYRHIAQLDSTLKTLEAVEVFQHQAGELRRELRSLRSAGWTQQSWSSSYPVAREGRARPLISPALPRILTELAFLIAVAVVVGVGHFSATLIVAALAGAWVIVGAIEWFASRERLPAPVTATAPAVLEEVVPAAPASPPVEEPDAYGWPAHEEPEAAESDVVPEPEPEPEAEAEPEPLPEPEPAPDAQAEPEPEPAANGRRRWFGRRRRDEELDEDLAPPPAEPPSHVRVLSAGDEPDEVTDEGADADAEPAGGRRRFRRR